MFLFLCALLVVWTAQDTGAQCPSIISRKEWDAKKAQHKTFLSNPVDLIIIEHTVTQTCSNDQTCTEIVRNLQKIHTEQSYLWDIAPSFLVGGTGKLYEGRGWHHVAIHTPGYNNQSIAIAFIGNFNNQEPSSKALDAAKALIQCGVENELLTPNHKVVVHSQLISTESPGKKLTSKVTLWPDWASDVSEIKKRADTQETQVTSDPTTNQQLKTEKGLILETPKQIDLLSNLRDVIDELIKNMGKLARGTIDTIEGLTTGMNKQAALFIEALASGLKKLKDQFNSILNTIPGIQDTSKCAKTLGKEANTLYDNTEAKAKACADARIKEIDEMIKNLGTLSSNAIDYTNTAVESTKNCTELNYGIEANTKACLNSVTVQTETASKTYESQRTTSLSSIKALLTALPAALDLCAKQHLLEAGTQTTAIVSKCTINSFVPIFGGFGR